MRALLTRRRTRGQGLAEVAVVCSIMSSMAGGGAGAAWQVLGTAQRTVAINQMKQIHLALTMAADDNDGRLPNAVMYPNIARDPQAARNDPRSIVRQVPGVPASLWVAPRAPQVFQEAGLTYIWNTAVNGQTIDQVDARTWLLADMNAAGAMLPDLFPQPTGIGFLVLYADGSVKYEMRPPQFTGVTDPEALRQQIAAVEAGGGPAAGGPAAGGAAGGQTIRREPEVKAPTRPDAKEKKAEADARRQKADEEDALDD